VSFALADLTASGPKTDGFGVYLGRSQPVVVPKRIEEHTGLSISIAANLVVLNVEDNDATYYL
jgi:hypothetical protein